MSQPEKEAKKTVFQEFREFAIKGNVIDLTVGVIIGAAFGKIVTSIVEDLVMPPIGVVLGRMDFTNMLGVIPGQDAKKVEQAVSAAQAAGHTPTLADYKAAGVATINYGQSITTIVQFIIVAFAVFFLVRAINRLRISLGEAPPEEVKKRDCPYCLSPIPEAATKCSFCTSEVPPVTA